MGKGLVLEVSIEKDVPEDFIGDPFRLRQILSNLIGNAVKFTNEGRIDIFISKISGGAANNSKIQFLIKDTGVGIPEDKKRYSFQTLIKPMS